MSRITDRLAALRRRELHASPLQMTLAAALFLLCAALVGFGWTARQTALESQRQAREANRLLADLKAVIYTRCQDRTAADARLVGLADGLGRFTRSLSEVADGFDTSQMTPATRRAYERQRAAIVALHRDALAVSDGFHSRDCSVYAK